MKWQFVLASASPARLTTLRNAGIAPFVCVSGIDEDAALAQLDPDAHDYPARAVSLLAERKAGDIATKITTGKVLPQLDHELPTLVLGCDSMLEIGSGPTREVVGKPHNAQAALARWEQLSGSSATLHTGHCLIELPPSTNAPAATLADSPNADQGNNYLYHALPCPAAGQSSRRLPLASVCSCQKLTRVSSTTVHFAELSAAEGQAYVATGEPLHVAGAFTIDALGGPFIRGIEGDHHSVTGLSLPLLRLMALDLGVFWPDLWKCQAPQ